MPKPGSLRFPHSPQPALLSVEDCQSHFPSRAFKTSLRGCPVPSWAVQVLCKGFIGFPCNPRNIGLSLSLPLFSTLSFPRDRKTPGQRAFAIQPSSIHHQLSPDPVAHVSSNGTLGRHRLSSFPGSQGTLQSKGPLGSYFRDACPSFRVSLSLFARSKV